MAKWTTDYPTKPGYYWLRSYCIKYGDYPAGPIVPGPEIVNIDDDLDHIYWTGDEVGIRRRHILAAEWFGPIQAPREWQGERAELERFLLFMLDRNLVATAHSEQIDEGINAFIGS